MERPSEESRAAERGRRIADVAWMIGADAARAIAMGECCGAPEFVPDFDELTSGDEIRLAAEEARR